MNDKPVILVVDDDDELRDTLTTMIGSVGLDVEGYASGKSFLKEYDPTRPGCLVLDVRLPELSGTDVLRQLRERGSLIPVIIMTGYADVTVAVETLKSDAVDFLSKPFSNQVLLNLIQKCVNIDVQQRQHEATRRNYENCIDSLTTRERELLRLLVCGHSNKSSSREFNISVKTIEAHRSNVMQKMGVQNFAELVEHTTRYGGITPDRRFAA